MPSFIQPFALIRPNESLRLCAVSTKRNQAASMNALSRNQATPKWSCMEGCGACCKLGEFDIEVIEDMLKTEKDVIEYLSMVGEDGWCRYFDSVSRRCNIYESRPRFCRVTPEVFDELYGVAKEDMDAFATDCCVYHIENIYGEESNEIDRYRRLVGAEDTGKQLDNNID